MCVHRFEFGTLFVDDSHVKSKIVVGAAAGCIGMHWWGFDVLNGS